MGYHTKTTTRSRRKRRTRDRMRKSKTVTLADGRTGVQVTLPFDPQSVLSDAFEAFATDLGITVIEGLLEDEADQLAGMKHAKRDGRDAYRHGYEQGSIVFAGKKIAIHRPRLRNADGELDLGRYAIFKTERKMRDSVKKKLLAKISTRKYEGIVDEIAEGYGIRKSSVSRHWKAATAEELAKLTTRSLQGLDLVAILLDGVHFQGEVLVVGLGIARDGKKHVLGLWEGTTENSQTVTNLLQNLCQRGLDTSIPRLFILDGGKALTKGVQSVFGENAIIQRCLVHKIRNVLENLPKNHHWRIRAQMRIAYGMNAYDDAHKALEKLLKELDNLCSPAANSLREGMEETLTLHHLGIPSTIRTVLSSTNAIENVFSTMRQHTNRVRNWKSGPGMRPRWAAAALLDSEKRFHRVKNNGLLTDVCNLLAAKKSKTQTA